MEDLELEQTVPPDAKPRRSRVDVRITAGRGTSVRIQFRIAAWESVGAALAEAIAGLEEVQALVRPPEPDA